MKTCCVIRIKLNRFKKKSVLSLSYYESAAAVANISQSWPHIMAEKTTGIDMV